MANYTGTVAAATADLLSGFRDVLGVLVDPATVKLSYQPPTGAAVVFTYPASIIKDAVGLYHYDVDTTGKVGLWTYEWISPTQTLKPAYFSILLPPL